MAEKTGHEERRREPRYQILTSSVRCLKIERLSGDDDEVIDGKILDISQGGAKLLVSSAVSFSESLGLKIAIPEVDAEIDVTADVCWSDPVDDGSWLLGCSFEPRISDELLGKLAVRGLIERRRSKRAEPIELSGTLEWQLLEQPAPVQVRDLSSGGFNLQSDREVPVAQPVILRLLDRHGDEVSIAADVQWTVAADGKFSVGCAFKNSRSYQVIRELMPATANENSQMENMTAFSPNRFVACLQLIGLACVFGVAEFFIFSRHFPNTSPAPSNAAPVENVAEFSTPVGTKIVVDERHLPVAKRVTVKTVDDSRDDVAHVPIPAPPTPAVPSPVADTSSKALTLDTSGSAVTRYDTVQNSIETVSDAAVEPNDELPAPQSDPIATTTQNSENTNLIDKNLSLESSDADAVAPAELSPDKNTPDTRDTLVFEPDPETDETVTAGNARAEENSVTEQESEIDENSLDRSSVVTESEQRLRQADVEQAVQDYVDGDQKYRSGRYAEAARAFQAAVGNDSENPLYGYLLAMAQYQTGQSDEATRTLEGAVQLERVRPVNNWGRALSRYQGAVRLWVEKHRSQTLAP